MAWEAVTRCPHPRGMDADVVSRVEAAMPFEAGQDADRRVTTAAAEDSGLWHPPASADLFDVYSSPEDKEIHDLIIRLGLSERDGNDLLFTLRKVAVNVVCQCSLESINCNEWL
jgi:hypothetical protein